MAYAENRGNVGAGFRAYTGNIQAAEAVLKQLEPKAGGLPEAQHAFDKNTVESALQQAQGVLLQKWGINRTQYQLLLKLVWYTQPVDWKEGNLCIAYPRNTKLAEDLALSVRAVQLALHRLREVGLIKTEDSSNRWRFGIRPSPTAPLSEAYGIDLSPLRTLAPRLKTMAAEHREAVRNRGQLRRKIGNLCGRGQELAGAACSVLDAQAALKWQEQAAELKRLHERSKSIKEDATLLTALERATAILAQMEDAMPDLPADPEPVGVSVLADDITRMGESNFTHMNTNTETRHFSKRSTVVLPLPEERSASSAPSDTIEAVRDELEREKITPELVCDAVPGFCEDMLEPDWPALLNAAYKWSREELDIRPDTLRLARKVLGDEGTAVAVATIVGRADAVERPGAYLRGMIERAQAGKLRLGQSIWGFVRAEQRASPKTEAVRIAQEPALPLDDGEPVIFQLRTALKERLEAATYQSWLANCSMHTEGHTVIVACPTQFQAEYVQQQFGILCKQLLNGRYEVKFKCK